MSFKVDEGTDRTEERYGCFLAKDGADLCECRGFIATRNCKHVAARTNLVRFVAFYALRTPE